MSSTQALKAVTGSKSKGDTVAALVEQMRPGMAAALPRHMNADRMARVVLTEMRRVPALGNCDKRSLMGAIITAAQLGLEPGNSLGHCYLLPYGKEATLIIGYRGMLEIARRSGQIISIEARAVYEADKFSITLGLHPDLVHEPAWEAGERGPLKFVYAVAKLKDGGVQFDVMSRAEIERVRAQSKAGKSGPWVTHFDEMAKKTVIRRLFKYLPVSIEMQMAVGLDEQAEVGEHQDFNVYEGVSEPEPEQEPERNVIEEAPNTLTYAQVADALHKAKTDEELDLAADLISGVADAAQQEELRAIYTFRYGLPD